MLGRFGQAQLQDVTHREERAGEERKASLVQALQALRDQATAQERATDNARSERALAGTEEFRKWQMANPAVQIVTGQGGQVMAVNPRNVSAGAQPVPGPGGAPLQHNQPLQQGDTKKLQELSSEVRNLGQLSSAFKDEYAGGGPIGRGLTAGAQLLGSLAPEKAKGMGAQFSQEAANFWSKFDRLVTLPVRNEMFGASLTPLERQSFEQAMSIKPGASPATIRKAMAEMQAIASDKLKGLSEGLREEGFNPKAIDSLTRGAKKQVGWARSPDGKRRVAVYEDGTMGE